MSGPHLESYFSSASTEQGLLWQQDAPLTGKSQWSAPLTWLLALALYALITSGLYLITIVIVFPLQWQQVYFFLNFFPYKQYKQGMHDYAKTSILPKYEI